MSNVAAFMSTAPAVAARGSARERHPSPSTPAIETDSVSLIVMEQGSAWPGRVGEHESLVAVCCENEVLLQRTAQKLESLQRKGQHLRVAVLACNEDTDPGSVARRAEVARKLLRALAASDFGRLLLTTGNAASLPLRRELLTLANALRETFPGTSVGVHVRFGNHDSGVSRPAARLVGPFPR